MMMTLARMYPVETQAISSRLAPRFPIMSGSATLTIELSMTCIGAASTTAEAIRYWCAAPSGGAAIGSVSGPSSASSGATALATDIACSQCKVHPVCRLRILLSRIDPQSTGGGRISDRHRFLHCFRARNLGAGENAVLLPLGVSAALLGILLSAGGQRQQEERSAEHNSKLRHFVTSYQVGV